MVRRPTQSAGRGHEAYPEGREGSRGPPEGPGGIGRPSRRSGRGREALSEIREGLRGPPEGPRRPSRRTVVVGTPSCKSGRGQEAITKVRQALPQVRVGSRGLYRVLGGVGRAFWRFRTGWDTFRESQKSVMEVWERLGGPPEGLERSGGPPEGGGGGS